MGSNINDLTIDIDDLSVSNTIANYGSDVRLKALYADFINKNEVVNCVTEFKNMFGASSSVEETAVNVYDVLSTLKDTNSNVFYNGDEAQVHVNNLKYINDDLNSLKTYADSIDLEELSTLIDNYNSRLEKLKISSRIELLKEYADSWNGENGHLISTDESFVTTEKQDNILETDNSNYYSIKYELLSYYSEQPTAVASHTSTQSQENNYANQLLYNTPWQDVKSINNTTSTNTTSQQYFIYRKKVYDNVKYWKYFENSDTIVSLNDNRFNSVEASFADAGCTLPYDKNSIIYYEK